jgi:hypothetical protein
MEARASSSPAELEVPPGPESSPIPYIKVFDFVIFIYLF